MIHPEDVLEWFQAIQLGRAKQRARAQVYFMPWTFLYSRVLVIAQKLEKTHKWCVEVLTTEVARTDHNVQMAVAWRGKSLTKHTFERTILENL